MAAANFSRDVLEMFYGPIEDSQRLPNPISPTIMGGFEIVRNNFNDWLRVYRENASNKEQQRLVQIFKKHEKFFHKCLQERS